MKFSFYPGSPVDLRCDLLVVPVAQGTLSDHEVFTAFDRKLDSLLGRLAEEERFVGKSGQSLTVHTHGKVGPQRLLFVGTGNKDNFDVAELRHVGARGARASRATGSKHLGIVLPIGIEAERAAQFATEGVLLGRYKFDRYQTDEGRRPDLLESVSLAIGGDNTFGRAVQRAEIVAGAVARARDLVNEPAAVMTPRKMAEFAEALAKEHGLEVRILGPDECNKLGMGMYLAVSQGSEEEPRFIHLTYKPKGAAKKRIALVGKGVTFDSGGLSLKPSNAMEDMKVDMAGAAAVINAIAALAQLQVPYEVHALAACTENMPSGKSYKLGDVLKSMKGTTVEINNTDAEGRLTLGDAMHYANTQLPGGKPDELFDFATLTGACMIALGPHTAGVMSNNPALAERWLAAAKAAGEEMWHLPLPDRLKDQLKSDIADMRNTGERHGGALTAGLFLREFADKTPWVHVDIAGPASADKEHGAVTKGGTGFAVATIVEYLAGRP